MFTGLTGGVFMIRFFRDHASYTRVLIGVCLAVWLFSVDKGWGLESSGLEIRLYVKQNQYDIGDAVPLVMALKNVAGEMIATQEKFSKVELHRYLKITDPAGSTHTLEQGTRAHDMPAPFFWKERAWSLVETLPENFVLSETVGDLSALFPKMKTMAGWYTIQAQIAYVRYEISKTREHSQLGTLGLVDSSGNWEGTIDSNEIQVFISPGLGARFQVNVTDESAVPLSQVQVKVFKSSDIPSDLAIEKVWTDVAPVLSGITDFNQGLVDNWQGAPCVGRDNYMAIAYYQGHLKAKRLDADDPGWASECGGVVKTQIVFGDTIAPFSSLSTFSILARNSVRIKSGAVIKSGHVGVREASSGLRLDDSGIEVSIGLNARTVDGVRIYGDSVKLRPRASIGDIHYNDLQNDGEIRGEAVTPLNLPLPVDSPTFPEITHGGNSIHASFWKTTLLDPGKYGDVSIGIFGKLSLKAGVYQFRSLDLGYRSRLECIGPGPSEIRIKQRINPGFKAKIGPAPQSDLGAKDVVFYIEGTNEKPLELFAYPIAAEIGIKNEVRANMVVPNGTLSINAGSNVQGSFIAQGIVVGVDAQVALDSAFNDDRSSNGDESSGKHYKTK